jgi:hypothetical protein
MLKAFNDPDGKVFASEQKRVLFQAWLHGVDGHPERAESLLAAWMAVPPPAERQLFLLRQGIAIQRALYLDALDRTADALRLLDAEYERTDFFDNTYTNALFAAAGLSLRLLNPEDSERRLRLALRLASQPLPLTLYCWLAGVLEQSGKTDEALALLEEKSPLFQRTTFFAEQITLFRLRHNTARPAHTVKKQAYAWMRRLKELPPQIFDAAWYRERYGALLHGDMEPFTHFMHFGRLLALDPNPLFNTVCYCLQNSDVMYGGYDPLPHYLGCNPFEIRDPSLLFCAAAYMSTHNKTQWPHGNALLHRLCNK